MYQFKPNLKIHCKITSRYFNLPTSDTYK